jgi:hypothetical protein
MKAAKLIALALFLTTEVLLAYLLFSPRSVYSPDLVEMVENQAANYPSAHKARAEEAERRILRLARLQTGVTAALLLLNTWMLLRIVRWKHQPAPQN